MKIRTDFVTNSSSSSFVSYSANDKELREFLMKIAKTFSGGNLPKSSHDFYLPISQIKDMEKGECGFIIDGDNVSVVIQEWEDKGSFYENIVHALKLQPLAQAELRVILSELNDNGVLECNYFIADTN